MSLSFVNAAKAKKLKEFFQQHGRIYIVVDATGDEVVVPGSLKGDPALRLVLNMRMPQAIHIREDALESDFSFSGQIYTCRIPMNRIWAAYLPEGGMEQGMIWEEDVPETIRAVVSAVRGLQQDAPDAETGIEASAERADPAADEQPEEKRVRHLRVVK
ncbi:MAG: ClpXP protease specificity-enhancing factor SspB [Mariprofundaceae bacterium]|nr:ClpXP protease specificity-enhancing factor SspB [Mariprofundaceae bacterium]